jgi:hypothetical protein
MNTIRKGLAREVYQLQPLLHETYCRTAWLQRDLIP